MRTSSPSRTQATSSQRPPQSREQVNGMRLVVPSLSGKRYPPEQDQKNGDFKK
jgi:hypothetical protein